ncbi:hypothetical protein PHJA_000159800 [Phtheirospermum japonicum]|uniref:Uncharacterized protein n=1 Tax=Phtheirospermum japonicum TaxID=374723 RepID=A0A830B6B9_9LAMI|nr:hypothetical protein PHJA_000159800 [Phtheirospermum japonicum]
MLFAVEGGGFFSSSASGYSKGLTLLLLGQKSEEKPMRVTPWSQYQLVDQDPDPDLQLASGKTQPVRGCASFVCFGCAVDGVESPSPLKSENHENDGVDDDDSKRDIFILKSSLKKTTNGAGNETSCERNNGVDCQTERKVQWTDTIGGELFEIREFEMRYEKLIALTV